ncbi:hypothetical protein MMC11_000635 [Xylographa trunciseda]|nr:hypothetical protein [Xylographa trunciseda]
MAYVNAKTGPKARIPAAFECGDDVMMQNPATGIRDRKMKVEKQIYNEGKQCNEYKLKKEAGVEQAKVVEERHLRLV